MAGNPALDFLKYCCILSTFATHVQEVFQDNRRIPFADFQPKGRPSSMDAPLAPRKQDRAIPVLSVIPGLSRPPAEMRLLRRRYDARSPILSADKVYYSLKGPPAYAARA
jgi:hypothetical protein